MQHWQALGCAAGVLMAVTSIAHAQPAPDRIRNVERAAAEIATIQAKSGSDGALAAILECYKRELARAVSLTPELEAWLREAADQPATPLTQADFDGIRQRARKRNPAR